MRIVHQRRPHKFGCKPWTSEDDRLLIAFAEKCLPWSRVTEIFPYRSASACQTRWNNYVRGTLAVNPRAKMNCTNLGPKKGHTESSGGEHYVFRVPAGDPLLSQLINIHGGDKLNRDVNVTSVTATRQIWPDQIPSFALAGS